MVKQNVLSHADDLLAIIRVDGAFLTVRAGSATNTMTIGWALLGIVWGKPMLTVAVRPSRHTFGLIEKSVDFAVSVPATAMSTQLNYCGTHSGRESDKYAACGLKTIAGRRSQSPIIETAATHFECRIVLKTPIDPKNLAADYAPFYAHGDFHTLYFGEILERYETA
jgi:flavin reductase (DIM6/NTAB) family NADH-FMN oxidoreductase RutF